MASILQLTDSAYFSCFKTQFHNIVAGEYSTGYIHIESCHVNGKTYLNTCAINAFQIFVTNQRTRVMSGLLHTLV